MKSVIIHEDAEKELWHAVEYYENKVDGLGLDFENEIQKGCLVFSRTDKINKLAIFFFFFKLKRR